MENKKTRGLSTECSDLFTMVSREEYIAICGKDEPGKKEVNVKVLLFLFFQEGRDRLISVSDLDGGGEGLQFPWRTASMK